jgi:hypothetical protein
MYSASDLTQTELANFRQEVAIMKQLRHPKGKCAHRLAPWCCFILAHLPISLRSGAVHGCFHDRRQPDGECCLLLSWLSCVEVGQHLVWLTLDGTALQLVTEFLPRGDLEHLLKDKTVELSYFQRIKMATDLAIAMTWYV